MSLRSLQNPSSIVTRRKRKPHGSLLTIAVLLLLLSLALVRSKRPLVRAPHLQTDSIAATAEQSPVPLDPIEVEMAARPILPRMTFIHQESVVRQSAW